MSFVQDVCIVLGYHGVGAGSLPKCWKLLGSRSAGHFVRRWCLTDPAFDSVLLQLTIAHDLVSLLRRCEDVEVGAECGAACVLTSEFLCEFF